jgi:hypothetical protein
MHEVCGTSNFEIAWGVREAGRDRRDDRSGPGQRLRLSSRFGVDAPRLDPARYLSLSAPSTALVANLEGSGLQFTMEV